MELGGDEKKIQALFSELSLENQSLVPQFEHLWTRARSAVVPPREKSFLRPTAVFVSVLVTAAVCSLAVWTWYRFAPLPTIGYSVPQPASVAESYQPTIPVKVVTEKIKPPRQKHNTRARQVERDIATEAALLSSWQSPTQSFMESPTSVALGSLPQLNQSVKDLESFLPKKNEIMKESNQ